MRARSLPLASSLALFAFTLASSASAALTSPPELVAARAVTSDALGER